MIAAWLFVGCMTTGQFQDRYATAFCELAEDCQVLDLEGYSTFRSCEDEVSSSSDDCEDYDRKAAKKCITALRESTCEDAHDGPPRVCSKVCGG